MKRKQRRTRKEQRKERRKRGREEGKAGRKDRKHNSYGYLSFKENSADKNLGKGAFVYNC